MLKKLLLVMFVTGMCYGQTMVFNRASKLDSTLLTTQYRADTAYLSLLSKILAGSADSSIFSTLFRLDTIKNNRIPFWIYVNDTSNSRYYSNGLYQTKGIYLVPADSNYIRAYSNLLYSPINHAQNISTINHLSDSLLNKAQRVHSHTFTSILGAPDSLQELRTIVNLKQNSGAYLLPADTLNKWVQKGQYLADTIAQANYRNNLLTQKLNKTDTISLSNRINLKTDTGTVVMPWELGAYQIKNTAAAGSYTNTNLTLDSYGRITSLSSGSGGAGKDTVYLSSGIPKGTIAMWSGSVDSIPLNWHLCDGTDGTPNLSGKFIKGYLQPIGTTGGDSSVSLTHSGTAVADHASKNTGSASAGSTQRGSTTSTLTLAAHTHSISAYTHTVTQPNQHSFSIEPEYYVLAYIMKTENNAVQDTVQVIYSFTKDTIENYIYVDYSPWRKISNISKLSDSLLIVQNANWYKKGIPIKYRANTNIEYYGLITGLMNNDASNQDTLIISGAQIPNNCDTLRYGDLNMVTKIDFSIYGTWNNLTCSAGSSGTADSVLYLRGDTEFKWGRSNAYLVQWGHKSRIASQGTVKINPWKNNEILIGNHSQLHTANWSYSSSHYINTENYKIEYGDYLDFRVENTTAGTGKNFILTMWFVLE